jgi:hypothetical protein
VRRMRAYSRCQRSHDPRSASAPVPPGWPSAP